MTDLHAYERAAWKLHTETFGGNMHEAAVTINRMGLATYLVTMDYAGSLTICVFRMPADLVHQLRRENGYTLPPDHDDYRFRVG